MVVVCGRQGGRNLGFFFLLRVPGVSGDGDDDAQRAREREW